LVRDHLGKKDLRPKYAARRPGEIEHISLDISKARRLLDWKPKIDIAEGARLTVQYFQKQARENVVTA
jgi:UDP-glucose 4-epimerase